MESFLTKLSSSFDHINTLNFTCVTLLGDFNDWCVSWDSDHTNSELGNKLKHLISNSNFFQLIQEPTRDNHHLLDLLLTDSPNFFLNSGVIGSLNRDIIFGSFKVRYNSTISYTRKIRNYNTANYDLINDLLTNISWEDNFDNFPVEDCAKFFTTSVT